MNEKQKNRGKKVGKLVAVTLVLTTACTLFENETLEQRAMKHKVEMYQPLVMADGVVDVEVLDKGTLERSQVIQNEDGSATIKLDYEINEVLDLSLINQQHMTYGMPPEFQQFMQEQGDAFKDNIKVTYKTTGLANGVLDSLLATPILGAVLQPLVGSLELLLDQIRVLSPDSLTSKNGEVPPDQVTISGNNISFDMTMHLADLHLISETNYVLEINLTEDELYKINAPLAGGNEYLFKAVNANQPVNVNLLADNQYKSVLLPIDKPAKLDHPAPNVKADDAKNLILYADNEMEYSTDSAGTWTAYDSANPPTFPGDQTVYVRYKETDKYNVSPWTVLTFTKNANPNALTVTGDDNTNQLVGADNTMEYSTDSGATWTAYDSANPPTFPGIQTVSVRYKETDAFYASDPVDVSFTKNANTTKPPVTGNDDNNVLVGADNTMEYWADGSTTWTTYDPANPPTFPGNKTVSIRYKETDTLQPSAVQVVTFTKNANLNIPNVTADDTNNKMIGADDTMQYSTDNGGSWTDYNPANEPLFPGDKTVLVRYKETDEWLASEATTLNFTIAGEVAAPNVTANDETNELVGADDTMEYSTDNGTTWTAYTNSPIPTFEGEKAVLVRYKDPQSPSIKVFFTKDPNTAVPSITANDETNELVGADATMEYSTDNGATWTAYTDSPVPTFEGVKTVQVRYKETETKRASKSETVTFTKDPNTNVPAVTANDTTNQLEGADGTMEYSMDGSDWVAYNPAEAPTFGGNHEVAVRYAETETHQASASKTVTFTKDPNATVPSVTANDETNQLEGADDTMEYSADGGSTWTAYLTSNPPTFLGNQTVLVRFKETPTTEASEATEVTFTKDVNSTAPQVIADDSTNKIKGLNSEMEYKIGVDGSWTAYDHNNPPTFTGDKTVIVRYKETETHLPSAETTVSFTKDPNNTKPPVSADDTANTIAGADNTMEYSTDGGTTWTAYDGATIAPFTGDQTVSVRYAETETHKASPATQVTFTKDVNNTKPNVTANDETNQLTGADNTMEYSTDDGATWTAYTDTPAPTFNGGETVYVRYAETDTQKAGPAQVVTFAKDANPTPPPVTANDDTNKMVDADNTMEYSTDGGTTWTTFDPANDPTFIGTQTVLVRYAETDTHEASPTVELSFTKNPNTQTPGVTADDTANAIVGADDTMEYSTDSGTTWTSYNPATSPLFPGDQEVLVRYKETETLQASNHVTLNFTSTGEIAAPSVTANDETNQLEGADDTMEYSTDDGATWNNYTSATPPVFLGEQSVFVRFKDPQSPSVKVFFSKDENTSIPSVTANDETNQLEGADDTIEYSTDGGTNWAPYNPADVPTFTGVQTVLVRYAETETNLAGPTKEVSFTKDANASIPDVTANDETNQLVGANNTMEYSTDGGTNWSAYDPANVPTFTGVQTVLVRYAETETNLAGPTKEVSFTKEANTSIPDVTANDETNQLVGADHTMEYWTEANGTWTAYDPTTPPTFTGDQTVSVRYAETDTLEASPPKVVVFTKEANPLIPSVTANDETNELEGADATMEYSADGGTTWTSYDEVTPPTFPGNKTISVRYKATDKLQASEAIDVSFTKNENIDIPSVTANDDTNKLEGANSTMEYSTDGGQSYVSYNPAEEPLFPGNQEVFVRYKETEELLASSYVTLTFTSTGELRPAPSVTADDTNNVLIGADNTMEYSTDGGTTWKAYDPDNVPTFLGAQTVQVRYAATETEQAGNVQTVTFTKDVNSAKPNVQANDETNQLEGADNTMEYSTDGGTTWTGYDAATPPTFNDGDTVQVRYKETDETQASSETTVTFSDASQPGELRPAPSVTADDTNNVLVGADNTMEYSTDGGTTWKAYDPDNVPTFLGAQTVQVRYAATETEQAGNVQTVTFTKDVNSAKPNVQANDETNQLEGADDTMEYSIDGGKTWDAYTPSTPPTFSGDQTVIVRYQETDTTRPSDGTTVTFSEDPSNGELRPAPSVTADDANNVLVGADNTMEYSTDGGTTWNAYDPSNVPTFPGANIVQVRYVATETDQPSNIRTVTFTKDANNTAPNVRANDETNRLEGADNTMEYSTDGGKTWIGYDSNNPPTFGGNQTVTIRYKESDTHTASKGQEVSFTKDVNPTTPSVTANDETNQLEGADNTMEYSTDGGTSWTGYDSNNPPTFGGNQTVIIRYKETDTYAPSKGQQVSFTKEANPTKPAVKANDETNQLEGADDTMEYSTDGGTNWTGYDPANPPTFEGNQTVIIRYEETDTKAASDETKVSFTKDTNPTKPAVKANDETNQLEGADNTMEYSTDGGTNWTGYDPANPPTFGGNQTVIIRYKETDTLAPSEETKVSFTKEANTTTPSVRPNEETNQLEGADNTMEYSTDGGKTWTGYDPANPPTFKDGQTVEVRYKETDAKEASKSVRLTFKDSQAGQKVAEKGSTTTEKVDRQKKETSTLPNTATNIFTIALAGIVTFFTGLFAVRRNKKSTKE